MFQPSNQVVGSQDDQPPPLGYLPEGLPVTSLTKQKIPLWLLSQELPRTLGALCQESGPNLTYISYNHNATVSSEWVSVMTVWPCSPQVSSV